MRILVIILFLSLIFVADCFAPDADTKLLIHFNGADGAQTYTTEDAGSRTVTFTAEAQLDTAQAKFGSASLLLDGTGDYVGVPDSDDWDFGTGDFTFDLQVRWNTVTGTQEMLSSWEDASNFIRFYKAGDGTIGIWANRAGSSVGEFATTSSAGMVANTWYHIAVVRNGTSCFIFVDGTSLAVTQTTAWGLLPNLVSPPFQVGVRNNDIYLNGWVDEVRVSKGIARWTSDFTAPTSEYNGVSKKLFIVN